MTRLTRHYEHWPDNVPHTLVAPNQNLFQLLENSAATQPDKVAINYYGHCINYQRLHQASMALAGYLQQRLGVQRGDRVMLLMQNCPQFIITYYAVLRCDAAVVAINPMSTGEEIGYYARDSGARVLITTQDILASVQPLLDSAQLAGCIVAAASELSGRADDVPYLSIPDFVREEVLPLSGTGMHSFSAALAAGLAPCAMRSAGHELAVVAYTSGTTGKPKGAMLSHLNFAHACAQRSLWLAERAQDSELVVLPMNHMAGMNIMNQAILVGRTMVLLARWDAHAAVELIERLHLNALGAVTPMLVEMFSRPDIATRDLSSLKRIYGGATAFPETLLRSIEQRLGVPFVESYGMTEACGATHINPPQAARRACLGLPHINCDARVIDPDSGEELGAGQSGELVMHTPTVFAGYWNNPEATAAVFIEIDGKRFFRSGDIGYYDQDGYFYITDRIKRMINASGLKVWPAEIEAALNGHPAVQEACVISARDERRGETVKAFVVLRPAARNTLSPEDVSTWARERLSAYKVPRLVEFVEDLPKTSTGKLLWRVLQDQQNERDRAIS
ncbi:Long-chain-fatty-acid--CoA ligase [compost metagenome]